MGTLENKIAVVTGSARGIGKSIATRLAREGASVVVSDVNGDGLEAVCAELEAAGAPKAVHFAADLSVEEGAQGLLTATLDAFGRCDILVNNAGLARGKDTVWRHTCPLDLHFPAFNTAAVH